MKWIGRGIGIVGFVLLLAACHQNGTVFAVDTTDDTVDVNPGDGLCADANGECSLRAAVMEANELPGVEEIRLVDDETYELTVPGPVWISAPVVITGDGTIKGNTTYGSIVVNAPDGLTEFDGPDFRRGGVGLRVEGGSAVSVRHADFDESSARLTEGSLSVWSSSFGPTSGDTIFADSGRVHIENTSMVGDSTIHRLIVADDADITVVSSSLARGAVTVVHQGTGSIVVQSTILDVNCGAGMTSLGHNLNAGRNCAFSEVGDIFAAGYPTTRELADNGGEVLSLQPDPFSNGVDAGRVQDCTLSGTDARGVPRPFGPACDIGAVELERGSDCATPGPGADLRFCDYRGVDFAGIDLSGADASDANFDGADLTGASLVGATLVRAHANATVFNDADFTDADLTFVQAFYADGADFTRATLRNASVRSAAGADFTDADAQNFATWAFTASMAGAHVEGADFTGGNFWGVASGGITGEATFSPGVALVNGYLIDDFVQLDGVDFADATTRGISFQRVFITNSDLTGLRVASSWAATYDGSTLDHTDWTDTYADNNSLRSVSMVQADLTGASIANSDWSDSVVVGVDFTDSSLWDSSFRDAVMLLNNYDNTICPSGVNSDDNGGNCDGQFNRGAPLVEGGAIPPEFEGMTFEDFFPDAVGNN